MIVSIDAEGKYDPVVESLLKYVHTDVPLLPVTRIENYKFNEELYKLKKYILVDFCEYGWDWDMKATHFFGKNTKTDFAASFPGDEWQKFEDFVKAKPPALYFKRELLEQDEDTGIAPINYPCWHPIPPVVSREEFNNRQLQANFVWGLSHEYRKHVHGEIWQHAGKHGYVVCDNVHTLKLFLDKEENPRKWLTANVPWYARFEMETIMAINSISKVSISLAGAGRHCFRHSESPINSIMYMWEDDIVYSYPWVDGFNCIKSVQGKEIETIVDALNNNPNLYEIYLQGVETCKKYYAPDYANNYVLPLINKAIK